LPQNDYGVYGQKVDALFGSLSNATGGTQSLSAWFVSDAGLTYYSHDLGASAAVTAYIQSKFPINAGSQGYGLIDLRGSADWNQIIGDGIVGPTRGSTASIANTNCQQYINGVVTLFGLLKTAYPSIDWAIAGLPHIPFHATYAPVVGQSFSWAPSLTNSGGYTAPYWWDPQHPTGSSGNENVFYNWSNMPNSLGDFYRQIVDNGPQKQVLDNCEIGWLCPDIRVPYTEALPFYAYGYDPSANRNRNLALVLSAASYGSNRLIKTYPMIANMYPSRGLNMFDDVFGVYAGTFIDDGYNNIDGSLYLGQTANSSEAFYPLVTFRLDMIDAAVQGNANGFIYHDAAPSVIDAACTASVTASSPLYELQIRSRNMFSSMLYGGSYSDGFEPLGGYTTEETISELRRFSSNEAMGYLNEIRESVNIATDGSNQNQSHAAKNGWVRASENPEQDKTYVNQDSTNTANSDIVYGEQKWGLLGGDSNDCNCPDPCEDVICEPEECCECYEGQCECDPNCENDPCVGVECPDCTQCENGVCVTIPDCGECTCCGNPHNGGFCPCPDGANCDPQQSNFSGDRNFIPTLGNAYSFNEIPNTVPPQLVNSIKEYFDENDDISINDSIFLFNENSYNNSVKVENKSNNYDLSDYFSSEEELNEFAKKYKNALFTGIKNPVINVVKNDRIVGLQLIDGEIIETSPSTENYNTTLPDALPFTDIGNALAMERSVIEGDLFNPETYNDIPQACACCSVGPGDRPWGERDDHPWHQPASQQNPCGWFRRGAYCTCNRSVEFCTKVTRKRYDPLLNQYVVIDESTTCEINETPLKKYQWKESPPNYIRPEAPERCRGRIVTFVGGSTTSEENRERACTTRFETDVANPEFPDEVSTCQTITVKYWCHFSGIIQESAWGCGCFCACDIPECQGYPCVGPILTTRDKDEDGDVTLGNNPNARNEIGDEPGGVIVDANSSSTIIDRVASTTNQELEIYGKKYKVLTYDDLGSNLYSLSDLRNAELTWLDNNQSNRTLASKIDTNTPNQSPWPLPWYLDPDIEPLTLSPTGPGPEVKPGCCCDCINFYGVLQSPRFPKRPYDPVTNPCGYLNLTIFCNDELIHSEDVPKANQYVPCDPNANPDLGPYFILSSDCVVNDVLDCCVIFRFRLPATAECGYSCNSQSGTVILASLAPNNAEPNADVPSAVGNDEPTNIKICTQQAKLKRAEELATEDARWWREIQRIYDEYKSCNGGQGVCWDVPCDCPGYEGSCSECPSCFGIVNPNWFGGHPLGPFGCARVCREGETTYDRVPYKRSVDPLKELACFSEFVFKMEAEIEKHQLKKLEIEHRYNLAVAECERRFGTEINRTNQISTFGSLRYSDNVVGNDPRNKTDRPSITFEQQNYIRGQRANSFLINRKKSQPFANWYEYYQNSIAEYEYSTRIQSQKTILNPDVSANALKLHDQKDNTVYYPGHYFSP
jgi:hypothetical protein